MAGETRVTVVGNLTADPDLRYTASGTAVANFTVAATPRVFDRAAGEWKDGDSLFLRCSIWWQPAEHVAASLTKGARVVVEGVLRQRSFESKEGEKRTVVELDVEEIGASLRYATVKINRGASDGHRSDERGAAVEKPTPTPAATRPVVVGAGSADDDF